MRSRSRKAIVMFLTAALLVEPVVALAQDGGAETRPVGGLEPTETFPVPDLPEPPKDFHTRAVNSDGGVSVPQLFNGAPGLCYPLADAAAAARIIRSSYPTCRERVLRLFPLIESTLRWTRREAAAAGYAANRFDASLAEKDAALARADARAEKLAGAVGSSSSTSWWTLFLAFVAGGLVAVGLSHALPR